VCTRSSVTSSRSVTRLVGDAAGIPFLDVGAAYRELHTEIDAAVRRTLERGSYVLGPEVEAFEHEYAEYVQAAHAVGTGNGLDALTLALRALEIGPGAEVIVPSHTFIATWLAVSAVGATPVPVDPDPETFLIDADAVAPAIGPRTRAIVPVHLYGRPVDLDPLLGLARQHGLAVVLSVYATAHAMPAVIGWHPCFTKPQSVELEFANMYPRDDDYMPLADLVTPPPKPWDDCFTQPLGPLRLHYPRLTVTVDSDCDHWVAYDMPDHITCVEPQSGPPDAFNIGGATRLEPGDLLQRHMSLRWSPRRTRP